MSEPNDLEAEVETLRRVNAELVTKVANRKTRLTELESTVTELQGKPSEAHDSLHEVTVGLPLRAMAESISFSPELWLEQFSKSHKLEMVKGQLTLQTTDGKPVLKGERPVPFERSALIDLLTSDAHPQAKIFQSITIASRATGANGQAKNRTTTQPAKEARPQLACGRLMRYRAEQVFPALSVASPSQGEQVSRRVRTRQAERMRVALPPSPLSA
jgi:hypothetical protein